MTLHIPLKNIFRLVTATVLIASAIALALTGLFIRTALEKSVAPAPAADGTASDSASLDLGLLRSLVADTTARRGRSQPAEIANPFQLLPRQPSAPDGTATQ